MLIFNTKENYGIVAKILHWVIALLVLTMLSVSFWMDVAPANWKGVVYNTHKLLGLTILMLIILRVFWAIINPKPELPIGTSRIQSILVHAIHGLLYIFVFLMPLIGWIMSSAKARYPHIGNVSLMLPGVPVNKVLAHQFNQIHYTMAWILIVLISLHILAAIKHAVIDRDGILKRMWFGS